MKGYLDVMPEVANVSVEKRTCQESNADILVVDDMMQFMFDTISLTGFRYRFDSLNTPELHPFPMAVVGVLSGVMGRFMRLPLKDRFTCKHHWRFEHDMAAIHQLVDEMIRARRQTKNGGAGVSDLLGLMLSAHNPVSNELLDNTSTRF